MNLEFSNFGKGGLERSKAEAGTAQWSLAAWLLERLHRKPRPEPRLTLLERIPLAPRQTVSLIEADGRRFLIATAPDGSPAFQPLDPAPTAAARPCATALRAAARVSW